MHYKSVKISLSKLANYTEYWIIWLSKREKFVVYFEFVVSLLLKPLYKRQDHPRNVFGGIKATIQRSDFYVNSNLIHWYISSNSPEFEYIYWKEFRRRQILEKKHRKALVSFLLCVNTAQFKTVHSPVQYLEIYSNCEMTVFFRFKS